MSLPADRVWLGLLACLVWTLFVVLPLIALRLSIAFFTVFEHVHALGLVALSEILVYWLATRWDLTTRNYNQFEVYQQTERQEEYPATPATTPVYLATLVNPGNSPPRQPARLGVVACCCWTVFVGIPVLAYHAQSNGISTLEHIHAAVLFIASEGLIYWLAERPWRRSMAAKRVQASRDPLASDEDEVSPVR